MAKDELDLAAAVALAQGGSQEAFDAIYERFADPIFRFLWARCGSPELAEDLSGDLWVRVVERLATFRFPDGNSEAAFAGWLYRIARNLTIDASRRAANRHIPLQETMACTNTPLVEQVIGGETQQELCAALDHLTPEQREVVVLRFFDERTTADVALLTGRTEGAVKVMQHRALRALARALGSKRGTQADNESR